MSFQQPFLYEAEKSNEARFPTSTFDPKAVTRKSYAPKMPRPKQEGPLVSFNRHPEYVEQSCIPYLKEFET